MRPLEPEKIISALNSDQLRLLTSLTEVSAWRIYFAVISPAILFLLDLIFDVVLIITYFFKGQIWEALPNHGMEKIISALNSDQLRLLTSLTEVSAWRIYFAVISPAILFLLDLIFDVVLIITYFFKGQIWEAIATIVVLLFAGGVTSLYYWFNEEWIDSGHDIQSTTSEQMSSQTQQNVIELTGLAHASNSQVISSELVPTKQILNLKSDDPNIISVRKKISWHRKRDCARYFLITPIFRAYLLVTELGPKIEFIRNTRFARNQLSEDEINAILTIRESAIIQACFNMIETFFEALPQILLQIYLAVHLKLTFELDSFSQGLIYLTIIGNILSAAYSATCYNGAYFSYLIIVRIKDILFLGGDFNKKSFVPVSWWTTIATFFFNLIVIVGRIYGLANILVAWRIWTLLIFVIILCILQYIWLETCPAQRMFYENPTRGITTTCSNLVDRWKNIFCFHQIRPSLKSIFTYHGIFLFLYLFFCKTLGAVFDSFAHMSKEHENQRSMYYTYTYYNSTLDIPANDSSNTNIEICHFKEFFKTCNLSHVILSENGVMIWCFISLIISLIYLLIRKKKDKILLDKHFPILKALELWCELTNDDIGSESIDRKRAFCLCLMASKQELNKIFGELCPCWSCFCNRREHALDTLPIKNISNLWENYTEKYKFPWLNRIKNINLRQILTEHWERMKKVKGENAACSVNTNYINNLNMMINPLFDNNSVDVKDLLLFMYFYDNFEIFLSKSNSFRLGKMFILLGQNLKNNKCYQSCIFH